MLTKGIWMLQFNTSAICPLPLPGASEESTQLNPLLQMPGPEPGSEPSGMLHATVSWEQRLHIQPFA